MEQLLKMRQLVRSRRAPRSIINLEPKIVPQTLFMHSALPPSPEELSAPLLTSRRLIGVSQDVVSARKAWRSHNAQHKWAFNILRCSAIRKLGAPEGCCDAAGALLYALLYRRGFQWCLRGAAQGCGQATALCTKSQSLHTCAVQRYIAAAVPDFCNELHQPRPWRIALSPPSAPFLQGGMSITSISSVHIALPGTQVKREKRPTPLEQVLQGVQLAGEPHQAGLPQTAVLLGLLSWRPGCHCCLHRPGACSCSNQF